MNHDYTSSPNPRPPRTAPRAALRENGRLLHSHDAYFDRAVTFVDRAAAHGILVLIAPTTWGSTEVARVGEGAHRARQHAPVCAAFGRYLGARSREGRTCSGSREGTSPLPPVRGEARHWKSSTGSGSGGRIATLDRPLDFDHLGGISTEEARFRDSMTLNGVYPNTPTRTSTRPRPRVEARQAPRSSSRVPTSTSTLGSNTQPVPKAWWWTMVSGGSGVL